MRNHLLVANVVAIPEESNADLEVSRYSFLGRSRTSEERSHTPALDVLRPTVASDSRRSLKSESHLSAHLCPDAPMRYCPEVAFAERSVQKPFTKRPPVPTGPGDIARPFLATFNAVHALNTREASDRGSTGRASPAVPFEIPAVL
jgi:hypothetical protein